MARIGQTLHDALIDAGFSPPDPIPPGKFVRFPGIGKGPRNRAGWCRLFPDGRGAVFGDFSSGFQATWQDADAIQDRREWHRQVHEARRQARIAREREQRDAATRAQRLWAEAGPVDTHPYLAAKNVSAHGTRVDANGKLLVPVTVGDAITSLQFIAPDGGKLFLSGGRIKGGCFLIGEPGDRILICEGFATGATLRQETGDAVFCAFNAGNLNEVARAARQAHPTADIVICGDNDHNTPGNPGKTKAQEAARAIGCKWVVPDFTGLDYGPKDTDFNDLARLLAARGKA